MLFSRKAWAVALAALVVAGASAPRASAQDKINVKKWALEGSEFVSVINVKQMLGSAVVKKGIPEMKEALKNNEVASSLLKEADLDPFKDIDSIVVSGTASKEPKLLAVIRGRFDVDKFHSAAQKVSKKNEDLKISTVGGTRLYEIAANDKTFVGAFANKNALVFTLNKDDTLAAIKTVGTREVRLNPSVISALGKLTGRESMVTALVINDEMKKALEKVPQAKEIAPKLENVNLTITLTDEANIAILVGTSDAKSAVRTSQLLRQLKSLAELMVLNNEDLPPGVGDVLGAIRINAERTTVVVSLKVDKAMLEKLDKKKDKKD
jgi:hypothetical protein